MSLTVYLDTVEDGTVFRGNITHNVANMAREAGVYDALWQPERAGLTKASQLIDPLATGIDTLRAKPHHFREFNAPNGWGTYDDFLQFVQDVLSACRKYPDAFVVVSR